MTHELHVICVAEEATAPEIGLRLRKGESAWLPADSLQKSISLRTLLSVRAVVVHVEKRCAVFRTPPPARATHIRPPTPPASAASYRGVPGEKPVEIPVPVQQESVEEAPPAKRRGRRPKSE